MAAALIVAQFDPDDLAATSEVESPGGVATRTPTARIIDAWTDES